jgi:hypothetical protein
MKTSKNIGIFMDHENARFISLNENVPQNIKSRFNHLEKVKSLNSHGENLMHNKEQHLQLDYYNEIASVIKNYDSVLLFGPTEAKNELFNILQTNHLFDKINIEIENTDKITENQQHSFVIEFFKIKTEN